MIFYTLHLKNLEPMTFKVNIYEFLCEFDVKADRFSHAGPQLCKVLSCLENKLLVIIMCFVSSGRSMLYLFL